MHEHVHEQLDQWKTAIGSRVLSMKTRTLDENGQSYDQLLKFQHVIKDLLEEKLIKQLLLIRDNSQSIDTDELDRIEEQVNDIKVTRARCIAFVDLQRLLAFALERNRIDESHRSTIRRVRRRDHRRLAPE